MVYWGQQQFSVLDFFTESGAKNIIQVRYLYTDVCIAVCYGVHSVFLVFCRHVYVGCLVHGICRLY